MVTHTRVKLLRVLRDEHACFKLNVFKKMTSSAVTPVRTLILGAGIAAATLVNTLVHLASSRYQVIGALTEPGVATAWHLSCPLLGSLEHIEQVIERHQPECIIVALEERRGRLPVARLVGASVRRCIVVEEAANVFERLTGTLAINTLTPSNIIFSADFSPNRLALFAARGLSLCVAGIALVLLLPLMLGIALAIKFDTPGAVLFMQDRIGIGGRRFAMFKFRSMQPMAAPHSEWARDNEQRITRVGRYLRRYRLDELPQLINILCGHMNLVGPRPHPFCNADLFTLVSRNAAESGAPVPFYELRSMIRPGVTGWAQVRYRYANDLDEEMEKLRYDLYYIKNYSFWLDLRILLETVKIVCCGHKIVPVAADCAAIDTILPLHPYAAAAEIQEVVRNEPLSNDVPCE